MRRSVLALSSLLAIMLVVSIAPAAQADDTVCTSSLGASTEDNIVVPDGASCTLDQTRAEGNVIVGTGATLVATGIDVDGNIQAEGAADVRVANATVGGNIQIEQGGAATVTGTTIDGDLQVVQQSGPVELRDNTIGGNLQCDGNTVAPTGGGNQVEGDAEDQCADLTGSPEPQPTPTPTPTPGPGREVGRLAGDSRFATAVAISQAQFPDGAATVYLARADEPADAIAGGSLTAGPILLVPACDAVPTVVLDEIRRLDPARVIALGGANAVCDDVLGQAAAA